MSDTMLDHATSGSTCIPSPLGACRIDWSAAGLTRVRIAVADETPSAEMRNIPAFAVAARDALTAYFAGERRDFRDVVLDPAAVPEVHQRLYAALRMIGYGETTTYGELAEAAGLDKGAARAVGVAMGRNPWPIIVPCHRVLAKGSKLGGFSAPGGAATKRRLLLLEGAFDAAGTPDLFA